MNKVSRHALAWWLFGCCAMVLVVLASGGATRLTQSGLSIVEWRPVTGILPPLSEPAWEAEFGRYRGTPEWRHNADMTLAGFKSIFWLEYIHRLLGRAAGLLFVVPFLYWAGSRRLERRLLPRLAAIALLWAFQGALGWFMVASGLVAMPRVSHYRLTAHLLTACLLFSAMFVTALRLALPEGEGAARDRALSRGSAGLLALAAAAIGSGGLVAGLRAGFLYATFPKMAGDWIPPTLLQLRPLARNLFENEATVQFEHRVLGLGLLLAVIWAWRRAQGGDALLRAAAGLLLGLCALQAGLGVATLLSGVHVALAVAHQANAVVLLGALLLFRYRLRA